MEENIDKNKKLEAIEDEQDAKKNVDKCNQEINEILKKYKFKHHVALGFPMYNQYPVELALALEIIQKNGPEFKIGYVIAEEDTNGH